MFKQKSDTPAKAEPADAVQQARTRARHRLIGAVVLLAIGIIGFPLVFETQPRPIPVDIPIEIPRRDAMPPLAMPAAPSSPVVAAQPDPVPTEATPPVIAAASKPMAASSRPTAVAAKPPRASDALITESSSEAGRDVTPARATRPTAAPASAAEPARRVAASASAPARSAEPVARSTAGDGDRARALLEGRPAGATESQRFIVQVGAFADAASAREARQKVDKLGLKTYTQVAQTASGSRIRVRVGPFSTRAEADAAVAKAKAAGLAAVVLTL